MRGLLVNGANGAQFGLTDEPDLVLDIGNVVFLEEALAAGNSVKPPGFGIVHGDDLMPERADLLI
ncbi:MAG TPA: hypothetical protein VIG90_15455 [Pedomonas sp.]|uniref:hypothetical protein n=1 Tax=Pedomonas sp. TaxID=2976421 RepID=UPI002F41BDB3